MIAESVAFLVAAGREVIFDAEHFFDGWKADADLRPAAIQRRPQAGARWWCCATPTAAACRRRSPRSPALPSMGWRCRWASIATTIASWRWPIRWPASRPARCQVQGTINGFGERCGNADLISVIANLALQEDRLRAATAPKRLEHLTELSRYVYEMVNMNFRSNQPFVGKSAFAHKGGMHVSGISRIAASYEHIDPASGRQRAPRAGQRAFGPVEHRRPDQPAQRCRTDSQAMDHILAQVVSMENAGYQFEAADGSFDLLVQPVRWARSVRISSGCTITSTWRPTPRGWSRTEATVKIRVGERGPPRGGRGRRPGQRPGRRHAQGPQRHISRICAKLRLVDYKVRVINSEAATAAGVRVVIESQDEHDVWGTVGVSENVIEASWIALVDSFEYKLYKEEQKP